MVSTKFHRHHKASFWFIITTFSGSCVYVFQKSGKCEVLNPLESLGKEKSLCFQEISEGQSCKSAKTFSRLEDSELELSLPEINQDNICTSIAG